MGALKAAGDINAAAVHEVRRAVTGVIGGVPVSPREPASGS
jgi:hypothetical protein